MSFHASYLNISPSVNVTLSFSLAPLQQKQLFIFFSMCLHEVGSPNGNHF
uniref:Uncharacterized protein n=1 Tax=Anguilla anguilla TaxID=7936 RepID=A0A0E9XGF1_ANGAN